MNFRQLYDEHFRFVWRSLRRLGVHESDLPDAVQDTFLVVHRRLPEFEGRSKVTTWLFGICLRVASDGRKRAHGRRRSGQPLVDTLDERVDVAAEAERRQALGRLELLLDELPLEQRAVFTLFELEGMTGDDIAETLEIPLGTVYSRLRLARAAFRQAATRLRAQEPSHVNGRRPAQASGAGTAEARTTSEARVGGEPRLVMWKHTGGGR
jgi:RNA polymerase sigma-70 factor (ECF subfamily)